MTRRRWSLPHVWTASQRRVVLGIVIVLLGYLALAYWQSPVEVDDPQPPTGARFDELQDRIDPNLASLATLSALPSLGEKRAKEIVAYRENFARMNPGMLAFIEPRDLLRVRGIGASIMTNLEPYLVFGPPMPATRPASQ